MQGKEDNREQKQPVLVYEFSIGATLSLLFLGYSQNEHLYFNR